MEKVEKLSADEVKNLEEQVSVPYRVEDVTVLSEGEWNGLQWTASELRQAVENTDFEMEQERGDRQPPNASLFYDHDDRSADQFVGRVENVRMEGRDVKSDLVVTDKQAAMNLEFGAPFGVSPKADGLVDESGKMQDFEFENFSLVVNPAVKTTWLNEDIESVLQDMEIHRPKFQSADDREWNSPNLEDFTDKSWNDLSREEKSAVGRHFLISKTGFPADNYTGLALPVVEPDGTLNLNALANAKARVSQVSGIDEDEVQRVSKMINNLANGNFDDADFEEVDMAKHGEEEMDDGGDGSEEDNEEQNNLNEDTNSVKNPMADEQETQEPDADESGQEESAEDYVTAEELEDFKDEVVGEVVESLEQELGDDEDEEEVEDEGDDVDAAESSDTELSEFEEFRQENPELSLSEAAEKFEEENKDVEEKIDEVTEMFESKISDLEEKLEEKEEEVEELSEKVTNPQRATQASGDEDDGEDLREKVANLSDEELHAQVFQQMSSGRGVTATKEMVHND